MMRVDQAVRVYLEYHRMNSGKKYTGILQRHFIQIP
jgi:hypothetical protein